MRDEIKKLVEEAETLTSARINPAILAQWLYLNAGSAYVPLVQKMAQDVPALCAEVRRLDAENEALKGKMRAEIEHLEATWGQSIADQRKHARFNPDDRDECRGWIGGLDTAIKAIAALKRMID